MAEQDKIKELIAEQVENRDPFSKARKKQESQGEVSSMSFDPFEDPISPFESRPVMESTLPEPSTDNLRDMLSPASEQETISFKRSRMASQLDTLGLSELKEGVALTNMGKILLMARLKDRLGDNFEANPAVRSILNLFDTALQQVDQKDEDAEMLRAKSTGDRTIQELLSEVGTIPRRQAFRRN